FVLGASGGPRIITATIQVLLNMVQFEMSPREGVDASRIHHQWMPDVLEVETNSLATAELKEMGHKLRVHRDGAVVQAASGDASGRLRAVSDHRKGGRAAGY